MIARTPLVLALIFSIVACKASVDEEPVYVPHPSPDDVSSGLDAFCQWDTIPSGPPDTTAHRAWISIPVEESESCEDFDPEDIDRALEEEIAKECDQPVEEFLRGCYRRFTPSDGHSCGFGAYYFSKCDVVHVME